MLCSMVAQCSKKSEEVKYVSIFYCLYASMTHTKMFYGPYNKKRILSRIYISESSIEEDYGKKSIFYSIATKESLKDLPWTPELWQLHLVTNNKVIYIGVHIWAFKNILCFILLELKNDMVQLSIISYLSSLDSCYLEEHENNYF